MVFVDLLHLKMFYLSCKELDCSLFSLNWSYSKIQYQFCSTPERILMASYLSWKSAGSISWYLTHYQSWNFSFSWDRFVSSMWVSFCFTLVFFLPRKMVRWTSSRQYLCCCTGSTIWRYGIYQRVSYIHSPNCKSLWRFWWNIYRSLHPHWDCVLCCHLNQN